MASTQSKTPAGRPAKSKDKDVAQDPVKAVTDHIGTILKQAREERGLDISAVAEELMIRRFYLEAMEEGAFHELPERVYATGFVRSYATYVGLDPVEASEQFKRDAYGARAGGAAYQVELSMPEPMLQSVMPNRAAILTALVVLAAIIGGIFYATQGKNESVSPTAIPAPIEETAERPSGETSDNTIRIPAPQDASDTDFVPPTQDPAAEASDNDAPAVEFSSPVSDATSAAPPQNTVTRSDIEASLPQETTQANLSDAGASAPQAVDNRLVIEAMKTAWVEVRDQQNTILFTSILKAGQLLPLPNDVVLTVTTGNAGGLRLIKDGTPEAQPMGQMNEVKRNVVLDPKAIFQR